MYGTGTRSYNRSTEAKEMKRQQKVATESYLAAPTRTVTVEPQCNCLSFRLPHGISAHKTLQSDYDWTPWEERYVFNAKFNCYELKIKRWERAL